MFSRGLTIRVMIHAQLLEDDIVRLSSDGDGVGEGSDDSDGNRDNNDGDSAGNGDGGDSCKGSDVGGVSDGGDIKHKVKFTPLESDSKTLSSLQTVQYVNQLTSAF